MCQRLIGVRQSRYDITAPYDYTAIPISVIYYVQPENSTALSLNYIIFYVFCVQTENVCLEIIVKTLQYLSDVKINEKSS